MLGNPPVYASSWKRKTRNVKGGKKEEEQKKVWNSSETPSGENSFPQARILRSHLKVKMRSALAAVLPYILFIVNKAIRDNQWHLMLTAETASGRKSLRTTADNLLIWQTARFNCDSRHLHSSPDFCLINVFCLRSFESNRRVRKCVEWHCNHSCSHLNVGSNLTPSGASTMCQVVCRIQIQTHGRSLAHTVWK